jgi:putative transcriptional regulator
MPPRQRQPLSRLARHLALGLVLLGLSFSALGQGQSPQPTEDESFFVVATEQLDGSSFQQTVILITHFSERGATGLAINRPTDIPLNQAFPNIQQLQQRDEPLYLGGPISTNALFVLLRTDTPHENMHRIVGNIYFSTAENAFRHLRREPARTYAGYTGWAPGQLQREITRGDWLVVHTDPEIIFDQDAAGLWQRLIKRWSGVWL